MGRFDFALNGTRNRCLLLEINCYFYINREAVSHLQESLIALEVFTTFL